MIGFMTLKRRQHDHLHPHTPVCTSVAPPCESRADSRVQSVQQPPKGVLALVPIREIKVCTCTSIDRVWGMRVQI